MSKTNKNHYVPSFTNLAWKDQSKDWSFKTYSKKNGQIIEHKKISLGKKSWGFKYYFYPQNLENLFRDEIETPCIDLYQKLINQSVITYAERIKWSQFLITQVVRTPSFLKYRKKVAELQNDDFNFDESIVGCVHCGENKLIADRNWVILKAHEEDYFIRTDNPVYMTGFLENDTTTTFYPLTPNLCFVACSVIASQKLMSLPPQQKYLQLEKGDTYAINFELLKSAYETVIVRNEHNSEFSSYMIKSVLGVFPQIPYFMMSANNGIEEYKATQELTNLMSITDEKEYPLVKDYPFSPFYGSEFSIGVNPFSVFGVTNDHLPKIED